MINIDNLRKNPALLKIELLTKGVRIGKISMKNNEDKEKYFYATSKKSSFDLPSEIILPKNTLTNLFISNSSPYLLDKKIVYNKKEKICEVKFAPEPKFSKEILSDGIPALRVASMYSPGVFSIFLNRVCSFVKDNNLCRFCSIEYTRKNEGKENAVNPSIEQVKEAFKLALKNDDIKYVFVTSGAYSDLDEGILQQMKYINAMRAIKKISSHLTTMPPKSDRLLKWLAKYGPDTISFDIEVFDKKLFEYYCPGKNKQIPYKDWLKIFKKAAKYFGKNRVKIGFVCGLGPLKSLVQGMEFVGKLGLVPAFNIFHPDEGTPLKNHARPSSNYILRAVKEQERIYKKYGLIPVFPYIGRRSSLDTEVFRGDFKNVNTKLE